MPKKPEPIVEPTNIVTPEPEETPAAPKPEPIDLSPIITEISGIKKDITNLASKILAPAPTPEPKKPEPIIPPEPPKPEPKKKSKGILEEYDDFYFGKGETSNV